jgi:hypothetical protein
MYNSLTNLYLLTADLSTRVHSQFCNQIPFIEVRTLFSETSAVNSRNVNSTLQQWIMALRSTNKKVRKREEWIQLA